MKKYYWNNETSQRILNRGYLDGESLISRVLSVGETFQKDFVSRAPSEHKGKFSDLCEKFEHYMSLGFFSLSSPVWANYGRVRGLPVSCNGEDDCSFIPFSVAITDAWTNNSSIFSITL